MDKIYLKINNNDYQPKIAIVSFPWPSFVPYKFLADMIKILQPITKKIIIITGNTSRINPENKVIFKDLHVHENYFDKEIPRIFHNIIWILKSIIFQIKGSFELINSRKEYDLVIFYVAYPYFLLILITAKILRKKTLEIVTRGAPRSYANLLNLQDIILFELLDGISPESPQLITIWHLEKYSKKLLTDGARFVDILKFDIYKNITKRENIIGFVSRLEKEKGIEQFVEAIPLIFKEIKEVKFYIVGSGSKLTWVREKCLEYQKELGVEITIFGWVDEINFPYILNDLKLVILPTLSEGLPGIVLELMSCGTPVLATKVGGIPDIIEDNVTGFLMEENSPHCIALHSIKILKYPDIEKISENGRKLIERKYSLEVCIERYKKIIQFTKRNEICT
jgi:glycosyltransferase involved in cell wall biosynthesis